MAYVRRLDDEYSAPTYSAPAFKSTEIGRIEDPPTRTYRDRLDSLTGQKRHQCIHSYG